MEVRPALWPLGGGRRQGGSRRKPGRAISKRGVFAGIRGFSTYVP